MSESSTRSSGAYGVLGAAWAVALERLAIGPVWLRKAVAYALLAGVLYWIPTYFASYQVTEYTRIMAFALAALGLNLLTGYTGQISVGHGAFMGVGAYTVAILVTDHGVSHLVAIVIASLLSFVLGVVVGLPALRIKGLYLALVTLALAAMFPQFIKRFSDITGGSSGKEVPRLRPPEGSGLVQDQWIYYLTLVVVVVVFVLVRNLVKSRVGRALIAIRDNETAAETMGVNVTAYKLGVFGVSALIAGLAGGISVLREPFVNAGLFNIDLSITLLVIVVIGGVATIFGPAIGAIIAAELPTVTQDLVAGRFPDFKVDPYRPVFFAGALILLVFAAPGGITGAFKRIGAEGRIQLIQKQMLGRARQVSSGGPDSPP